jgi:hypothetical protein
MVGEESGVGDGKRKETRSKYRETGEERKK